MAIVRSLNRFCAAGAIVFTLMFACRSSAQTVWSGLSFSFSKADFTDASVPQNQDRITDSVWLTRGATGGIYNIRQEPLYNFSSPADTEWATGLMAANNGQTIAAANWSNLTFAPWITAYGGTGGFDLPDRLIGRDAVLHLISDDVYLDIQFTAWTTGHEGSGGFSYLRAAIPEPTTSALLLIGIISVAGFAYRGR